ncbi:MAG: PDDEXK nuclease domain-containing protein [Coriobacteriia bacterium]|nr:PDDEXK nuclease domain-containing protein [Coriobacteriia bacterium]
MSQDIESQTEEVLFADLSGMIKDARARAVRRVNSELVMLYWAIGKRIREDILGSQRAEYGRAVVQHLSDRLAELYGRGYTYGNITRMMKFAELYPDSEIVAPLAQQLTWTNVTLVLALDDQQKRDFYLALAARERWSKRTLQSQIDSKLYERTIAACGTSEGLEQELEQLCDSGSAPGLVFRDPYMLDFLGLQPEHSEVELERAILDEMQRFLLELGSGFAFVARQKRIIVDGEDYHLDLLFYHIYLRRYFAVELKTRSLQPADKGQMELYRAWLDAHVKTVDDAPTLGLILCTHRGDEQVGLLGLDVGDIRAAQYLTQSLCDEMQRRLIELTECAHKESADKAIEGFREITDDWGPDDRTAVDLLRELRSEDGGA